ncbi:MAG: hypothetical protein AAF549_07845 [Pseudomonadota bacterium]
MNKLFLIGLVFLLGACTFGQDEPEREIVIEKVPYDERTVTIQASEAFTSCPPQDRQEGRC